MRDRFIRIVTRFPREYEPRLKIIREKYGFSSNYEICKYLMHCFLRVADPDNDPIMEPIPEEIESMFGDLSDRQGMKFEKPKRRTPCKRLE